MESMSAAVFIDSEGVIVDTGVQETPGLESRWTSLKIFGCHNAKEAIPKIEGARIFLAMTMLLSMTQPVSTLSL